MKKRLHPCRFLVPPAALAVLLLAMAPAGLAQPESRISWEHHDWGRFPTGSWQRIRIVTENYAADGEVLSTTSSERLTQMVRCTRRAVTLRTWASMEVAGKTFEAQPHDVRQGNHGEPIVQDVSAKDLGESEMVFEGRHIPCRIKQFDFTDAEVTRRVKVYYSDKVAPFILRREETTSVGEQHRTASTTRVNVLAFDKPHQVLSEIMPTSYVKEVHQTDSATTTTLAVHAADVPGGIVAYTTKEIDAEGNLIRRSTAELVDYGFSARDLRDKDGGGGGRVPRRGFRARRLAR